MSVPIPPLERHISPPSVPNQHVNAYEVKPGDHVVFTVKKHRRIGEVWAVIPTPKGRDYVDILLVPQGHKVPRITVHKFEKVEIQ